MLDTRPILLRLHHFRAAFHDRIAALDGRAARTIVWLGVAAFLLGFGYWATRSGLQLRDNVWADSRSIRYHGDISNAMRWGDEVLQSARQEMPPPAAADRSPGFWQIVRGEGRVYEGLVDGSGGDYQLDYPPLRLLTMSLWMRHVQADHPNLTHWPGPWRQGAHPDEAIASPLVNLNTLFTWLSSLFAFFLVWLWVDRGGRRGTSARISLSGPRRPPWREPTPLIASAGLVLFLPLACLFYYALLAAVAPSPAPPPMVEFEGAPTVLRTSQGITATIRATINSQGAPTQWSVVWGTAPGAYPHTESGEEVSEAGTPTDVSLTLSNLPPDAIVHYRITARNDGPDRDLGRGMTRTDDATLLTSAAARQPQPPGDTYGAVWLSLWQWLGVGLLFAALCGSMRDMPAEHRGWACGLLAAMLLWLNPAVLVDTHVWPQWDVWLLPPLLLSALLASLEWWFTAGLIFGIGTMFKGQFLIGSPVLLLWPLLSMRWGALARILTGILLSTALILSPWLALANQPLSWSLPAVRWIARVGAAAVLASLLPLLRRPLTTALRTLWGPKEEIPLVRLAIWAGTTAALLIAIIALILARWPLDAELQRAAGLWLLLGILICPWIVRWRWLGVFAAGAVGIAIWMSAWLYHGDWSWESVGFEYGMSKFDHLAMARGSNGNLASILEQHFGWDLHDQAITLHLPNLSGFLPAAWASSLGLDGNPLPLDLRQTLIAAFAAGLVACGVGAAMNDRRNHPRFLAALVAPWMLMPNVLGQMMCRYQIWGAALSALLVGISPGFTLVNALLSVLAAGMIGNQLFDHDPARSPQLHQIISNISPDDGWITLGLAVLVLFIAMTPGRIAEDSVVPKPLPLPGADLPAERSPGDPEDDYHFVLPDDSVAESEVRV
jgi:hypothetical protein